MTTTGLTTATRLCLLLATLNVAARGQIEDSYKCIQVKDLFPPQCTCTTPSDNSVEPIMDCSGLGLTSVPEPTGDMPHKLFELRLNDNSITSLPVSAFQKIRTSAIDLLGNAITEVPNDVFSNLIEPLTTLKLQGDGTNHPPKTAFQSLNQLMNLHLKGYNVISLHHLQEDGDPYAMFLSLTQLRSLTLEDWNLQFVEPDAFEGPERLEELYLLGQKFTNILATGARYVPSLIKLTVTGTDSLGTVTPSAFSSLTSLKTLDLSNNHINTIENDAFGGLTALESLSVSHNLLQVENIGTISGLDNLLTLDLSYNEQLSSVPSLQSLNSRPLALYLSNCGLTQLSTSDLEKMPDNLSILDLSSNSIASIDENAFQNVGHLNRLFLAHQSFPSTSSLNVPSSLSQVPLTHLDLSGQPLVSESLWQVVKSLGNLIVLDLSSTDQTSIPNMTFQNMNQLEEIYLDYSSLTELTQEALVGPRSSLKKLSLNGNQFTTLPFCLLYGYQLPPVLEISLEPNNLICDCVNGWIHDYETNGRIKFTTPPMCPSGQPLLDELAVCPEQTDQCPDYYQNAPDTPAPPERPSVNMRVGTLGDDKLTITWSIPSTNGLVEFKVRINNPQGLAVFVETVSPITRRVDTPPLPSGVIYSVCVTPVFTDLQRPDCTSYELKKDSDQQPQTDDSDDDNTGIIVGAVVAAVVLIILLLAIGYLVFLRRKPKRPVEQPRNVQPRTFTKSELPSMAGKEGMQVVAISDGMAHNGSRAPSRTGRPSSQGGSSADGRARVGRAHLLASEGSTYKDMTDLKVPSSSGSISDTYENDRGPLPKPPRHRSPQPTLAATHAYYNEAFNSKYDEIEPPLEATV